MVRVKMMTNMERKETIVPVDTMIADLIEEMGFDPSNGWQLNGRPVMDFDETLEDAGIEDGTTAFLNRIVKADCA